jgi:DHA3 family macrolide efflux protein-like MFS transporter
MTPQHPESSGYHSLFTVSFSALLIGQVVSILGDRLNNIALIELLSMETGRFAEPGSTFELSKLALAMTVPSLVLGPFAGAFIDRVQRKRVLVITDIVRGSAVLAIPFLRPALPLWTVYGMVALLYLANLFFLPARCAIVPEIVARGQLIKANSALSMGATIATIVGFGIGGVIASKAGWRVALFIDALTYYISAGALAFMKPQRATLESAPSMRKSYLRAIREAVGEIRRIKATRIGVVAPPLLVVAGTAAYVLGVAILEARHPEGTMHVGFMVSLAGMGMALGCYLTGRLLPAVGRTRTIAIATPLAVLPLAAIGLTGQITIIGIAVAVAGLAAGPVFVSSETAIQEQAPRRRQATVFALRDMLMKAAAAIAATLAAVLATAIGLRSALLVLLAASAILSLPILRRHQNEEGTAALRGNR